MNIIYCSNCGEKVSQSDNYCKSCGNDLNDSNQTKKKEATSQKSKNTINPNKKSNALGCSTMFKVISACMIFIIFVFLVVGESNNNGDQVSDSNNEQVEEVVKDDKNVIHSDKGFIDLGDHIEHDTESSILYSLVYGDSDYREVFVEKWNYELDRVMNKDIPVSDHKIDENWWQVLELSVSDIEPRNAPGWDDTGGDIYDVVFDEELQIGMSITNPPITELNKDNPNLNRFIVSVYIEENLNEANSQQNFLSRRRQVVQTMHVALNTIFGIDSFDKNDIYKYVADFTEDSFNINNLNINFQSEDWGYYYEGQYNGYEVIFDLDQTGDFGSEFYLLTDFKIE